MKNIVKNYKKGFTLVEVIVVIVIIAILAAIAIPALTGYIEKAKDRALITQARQCVLAAQSIAVERHPTKDKVPNSADAALISEVSVLSEHPASGVIDYIKFSDSVVTKLSYTNDGKTVIYENEKYTIMDATSTSSSNEFKDVTQITDEDEKLLAIEENLKLMIGLAEEATNRALNEVGAKYFDKKDVVISIDPNKPTNVFTVNVADADGNKLGALQASFNKHMIDIVNENNINIGYTQITFGNVETVNGKTFYSTKPSKIRMKSVMLTGTQSDPGYYTYIPGASPGQSQFFQG